MLTAEKKMVEPVHVGKYGYTIVQIETKSVCNMKCAFCPYPIRDDKDGILPDQAVYNIIDSIVPGPKFEYVCLSQFNEPLMDNRIYDFVAYTKSKGLPVQLISNGLLFRSKDKIAQLVKPYFDELAGRVSSAIDTDMLDWLLRSFVFGLFTTGIVYGYTSLVAAGNSTNISSGEFSAEALGALVSFL